MDNDNRPVLDLTRHHFMRDFKDLAVFGTWIWSDAEEDYEPCLAIVPRFRRDGFKPACIALSALHKYTSAQYLEMAAKQFNADLGFEDSWANIYKIADCILEHMRDVLHIPPNPTQAIVVGEVTVNRNGNKERSGELMDYVPLAQA
jgi:hypothetical protein